MPRITVIAVERYLLREWLSIALLAILALLSARRLDFVCRVFLAFHAPSGAALGYTFYSSALAIEADLRCQCSRTSKNRGSLQTALAPVLSGSY